MHRGLVITNGGEVLQLQILDAQLANGIKYKQWNKVQKMRKDIETKAIIWRTFKSLASQNIDRTPVVIFPANMIKWLRGQRLFQVV